MAYLLSQQSDHMHKRCDSFRETSYHKRVSCSACSLMVLNCLVLKRIKTIIRMGAI